MKNLPKANSGQALLLVLLSMAVVLTIVLSIISRSVTDISVVTTSEESLRAFSAAEAGVEQALIAGSGSSGSLENASFSTSVSDFASGAKEVFYPDSLSAGDEAIVWLVSHDKDGDLTCSGGDCFKGKTLKVCWGKEGTSASSATTPAVEVSVFYQNSGLKIVREALDPNSSRRSSNSFAAPDAGTCSISGTKLAFQKTLDLSLLGIPAAVYNNQDGLQYAVIRFFYNTDLSQPFGASVDFGGNSLLPSQGVKIDSQGASGVANRRVEVVQGYAQLPEIFSGAVFGQEGVGQE